MSFARDLRDLSGWSPERFGRGGAALIGNGICRAVGGPDGDIGMAFAGASEPRCEGDSVFLGDDCCSMALGEGALVSEQVFDRGVLS